MYGGSSKLTLSPSLQLLEVDPEKRLKLRDLGEHPYFDET
jgi:hypothetical protein